MCQKCQIQTDENGAFSPGMRDAQAVCCFLLWLWGPDDGWEGKKQRERQREGKRARESELFSQTWSLSLTKHRAPKPQCCSVPKGTTLQKLTSKQGWSWREKDNFIEKRQTHKPRNLTVTPKTVTFYRLNLVLHTSTKQLLWGFVLKWSLYLMDTAISHICALNMKRFLLEQKSNRSIRHTNTVQPSSYWSTSSLSLMSVPLSPWSMSHWLTWGGKVSWQTHKHTHRHHRHIRCECTSVTVITLSVISYLREVFDSTDTSFLAAL